MSSFRLPQNLSARLTRDASDAALHHEIAEEQAQSLGRAGRKVEAALAALRDHPGGDGRAEALKAASAAVWEFFVHREILGLRNRADVIAQYAIPREVMVRLGAR